MTQKPTVWTEFFTPAATTDRGWLKAITGPWDDSRSYQYTHETMPVWDEEIGAWREQSTLGCYLDYGPLRQSRVKQVHAVCYAAHSVGYFDTVPEAKEFIEREAMRVRPDVSIQMQLGVQA